MALDEVQASKGAFDAPDDRDYSADHILGAEAPPLPDYVNLNIVPSHNQGTTFRCFPAGTSVILGNGKVVNIEEVVVGDTVLDGYGEVAKVTKTYENDFDGELVKIRNFRMRGLMKLMGTPNHKVRILRGGEIVEEELQNIKEGEHLALVIPKVKPLNKIKLDLLDFIEDVHEFEEGKLLTRNSRSSIMNRFIDVDEDFLFLCGLFLAEGSISYSNFQPAIVQFSLHDNEQDIRDIIRKSLIKLGVPDNSINEYSNGGKKCTKTHIHNNLLGYLFLYLFGKGSANKRVPFEWLGLPPLLLKALLKGLLVGDGYITNRQTSNEIGLGLVSKHITMFVFHAALVLGIQPSIGFRNTSTLKQKRQDVWEVYFYGQDAVDLLPDYAWEKGCLASQKRARNFMQSGFYFVKVQDVEKVPFIGKVYNLEVEGSHTYSANCVSVNNCTSYGLTHVVEILNTLEHKMQVVLDPDEQWRHQLHPPDGVQFQPPAVENYGDSLQHALRLFMHFGLENKENPEISVDVFKAEGYAAIQKTLADYRRWLALGFPVYSGWLGHCFAIVGYDDKRKQLICKNSYGAKWGGKEDGTFEIDYFDIPRLFTGYILYDKKDLMHIFKDVTDKSPMAEAILFCRDKGFVRGYGEGTDPTQKLFMPDAKVSRAELCQILFNIFKDKQL